MKFILAVYLCMFLYIGTAFVELELYHDKFNPLQEGFYRVALNDQKYQEKTKCWLNAMRQHVDGYADLHLYWLPSMFEVNRRTFGKECEAL